MFKKLALSFGIFLTLLACGEKKENEKSNLVVIYSNALSNGRDAFLKEEAKKAGFEVEFVQAGGGEIADRLIAEKNNPIADVVFGPNELEFLRLEEEAVLDTFKPSWVDKLDKSYIVNKEDLYYPLVKQATLMVYNTAKYDENTVPKDWTDLYEKEEFRGKYEYNTNIKSSTMKKVISGILTRYKDENGEFGISQKGWEAISLYFNYGVKSVKGEDLYSHIATGKVEFGPIHQSGVKPRNEQYQIETKAIASSVGVPISTEQIAIVKGSKNPEKAKEFINWFGDTEMQVKWSEKFSSVPVNLEAYEKISQDVKDFEKTFTKQDLDWKFIKENIDSWIEKIELEILK